MANNLTPSLPDVVQYQLPQSISEVPANALFVKFVEYYYDWLTAQGQPTEFITNLMAYRDLDLTNPTFVQHITDSLLTVIPAASSANKTLLTKHIAEFLRAKGSADSFSFIMNAIFGQDASIDYSSEKLFRASDNKYSRNASLTIESSAPWINVAGSTITQTYPSPATGLIFQNIPQPGLRGKELNFLTLDDKTVQGNFVPGGTVEVLHNNINRDWYRVLNYYGARTFQNNILTFTAPLNDKTPYEGLVVRQLNSTFRAVVVAILLKTTQNDMGLITISVTSQTGSFTPGNELYILASSFENISYTKTDFEYGNVSSAVVNVDITYPGALYSPGDNITFLQGSGQRVAGYVSEVTSGGVDTVNVVQSGYGYSVGDKLTVNNGLTSGSGLQVSVKTIDGINGVISPVLALNSVSVVNGGTGFKVGDVLTIPDGTTVVGIPEAVLTVSSVNSAWAFKGVSVTASGKGYPSYTSINLIDTSTHAIVAGFAATPTFNSSGGIISVKTTGFPTISSNTLALSAGGYGATATPTITTGSISAITPGLAGVGYIDPIVTITGDGYGATITVTVVAGAISTYSIISGGTGYTTAALIISERYGSGFSSIPLIYDTTNSSGGITGLTITSAGQYTNIPSCFSSSPTTTSTTSTSPAILDYDFKLFGVNIDNAGNTYHAISTIVDGKGSGAQFAPSLTDGVIKSFTSTNSGTGYTKAQILASDGVGLVAVANISGGNITGITVINGGQGYLTTSTISIIGDGTGAAFNIGGAGNVANGVLSDIHVLNGGSGYYYGTTISAPTAGTAATVTPIIVNGVIENVTTTGGSGYIISELANIAINSGTQPTVAATVNPKGQIPGYISLNKGTGYFSQSEVTPISIVASGPGTGAKFLPTLNSNGEITKVSILNGGSGYVQGASTITVTGGGSGTGAVLSPVCFQGKVTDVIIVTRGTNYKYGTSAIISGDGTLAAITPIVETGITSANIVNGGGNYAVGTILTVVDTTGPGAGATVIHTITNGVITGLTISNKGSGYITPAIVITNNGSGYGAVLTLSADRFISSLNITNAGINYSYSEILIIGDGSGAKFSLLPSSAGTIQTATVTLAGTGVVHTPKINITDPSGYGAVSSVSIDARGGGYSLTPVISLPDKYNISTLVASGTKFICYGENIGGVVSVQFVDNGAQYDNLPTPIFNIVAVVTENASFIPGEKVTIVNDQYKNITSTNRILLENGVDYLLIEDSTTLVPDYCDRDIDDTFFDVGFTATVNYFDFDRNILELNSGADIFNLISEDGSMITTENGIQEVDQMSSSVEIGDTVIGSASGAISTIVELSKANGVSVAGGNGWSKFAYMDNTGMLNNASSVIADNNEFQDYAYTVTSGLNLDTYEAMLKQTCHPAGFKMFGKVATDTEVNSDLLRVIGNNQLIVVLYLMTISAVYQSGTEYSALERLFGDYSKFNFDNLSISEVQDYQIWQTSKVIFANVPYYYAPPVYNPTFLSPPGTPSHWNIINGASIITGYSTGPDNTKSMTKISDSNANATAGVSIDIPCTVNDLLYFEMFITKIVGAPYFSTIRLGDDYINIDVGTGNYVYNTNNANIVNVVDMSDYWFVSIQETCTATGTVPASIYPAAGNLLNFGVNDITAVGYIDVHKPIVKIITGIQPVDGLIYANNSKYTPHEFYRLDTESRITVA